MRVAGAMSINQTVVQQHVIKSDTAACTKYQQLCQEGSHKSAACKSAACELLLTQ